ncbi:MAG: class I SAM-dependent methyltransferase [Candidatus Saccharimonadaceae bacterium]
MIEQLNIYEKAITTERPAEMLAKKHGFENLALLAQALPTGAQVLDVGAGASPFGKEVASLRPDVAWVNFDYSYKDPAILAEVRQDVPSNVEHVAGDATKLAEMYAPETFDAVFSYWLLPHLSIDDTEPAKEAAKAIFTVTKPGGLMSVGPKTSQKRIPALKSGKAIKVAKDDTLDVDSYAERIVAETKLSKTERYIQKLANEVATQFFGTSRYVRREGGAPKVFHPESGEYVSILTRKGVRTLGRLAIATVRHAAAQRKK